MSPFLCSFHCLGVCCSEDDLPSRDEGEEKRGAKLWEEGGQGGSCEAAGRCREGRDSRGAQGDSLTHSTGGSPDQDSGRHIDSRGERPDKKRAGESGDHRTHTHFQL